MSMLRVLHHRQMSQASQGQLVTTSRPAVMVKPEYRMIKRRSDAIVDGSLRIAVSNAASLNGSRDSSSSNIQASGFVVRRGVNTSNN